MNKYYTKTIKELNERIEKFLEEEPIQNELIEDLVNELIVLEIKSEYK